MSEMMHTGGEALEPEWLDGGPVDDDANQEFLEIKPVKVEFEQTQQIAPDSATWMFYNIPVLGQALQPLQLLPHKYHRYKAFFLWTMPASTTIYLDRIQDRLMSNALGTTFQFTNGATAITASTKIVPDYDGQQPLYCIASIAGATVAVLDESYKPVQ